MCFVIKKQLVLNMHICFSIFIDIINVTSNYLTTSLIMRKSHNILDYKKIPQHPRSGENLRTSLIVKISHNTLDPQKFLNIIFTPQGIKWKIHSCNACNKKLLINHLLLLEITGYRMLHCPALLCTVTICLTFAPSDHILYSKIR